MKPEPPSSSSPLRQAWLQLQAAQRHALAVEGRAGSAAGQASLVMARARVAALICPEETALDHIGVLGALDLVWAAVERGAREEGHADAR